MYIQIIISRNSIHNTLYDDNGKSRSSHCLETGAETRIAIHTQIYVVYLDFMFRFDSNSDEKIFTFWRFWLQQWRTNSSQMDRTHGNRVRTFDCPFKCLISKANYWLLASYSSACIHSMKIVDCDDSLWWQQLQRLWDQMVDESVCPH